MPDFEVISEVTLGSDTGQWEIDEIPQDYTHLQLELNLQGDTAANRTYEVGMFFNTYTGQNKYGYGVAYSDNVDNGSGIYVEPDVESYIKFAARQTGTSGTYGTYAITRMLIANYSSTSITQKQMLFQQSAGTAWSSGGTWWVGFGAGARTDETAGISKLTMWPISAAQSGQKLKAGSCYTLSGWK